MNTNPSWWSTNIPIGGWRVCSVLLSEETLGNALCPVERVRKSRPSNYWVSRSAFTYNPTEATGHYSLCSWSGWARDDEITTHWLLTSSFLDRADEWSSTRVGQDHFKKILQTADDEYIDSDEEALSRVLARAEKWEKRTHIYHPKRSKRCSGTACSLLTRRRGSLFSARAFKAFLS